MYENEDQIVLAPYKTIGTFISKKAKIFTGGNKMFLAATANNSYKVYKLPDLKIKLSGPHFPNKIKCISAVNDKLFISMKKNIFLMKFYHIEKCFNEHENTVKDILLIGADFLISVDKNNRVISRDLNLSQILSDFYVDFDAIAIAHPPTYINKILIVGKKKLELWNIATGKKIYSFEKTLKEKLENFVINVLEPSPVLDLVAIGLNNGEIIFLNIRTDEIFFSLFQNSEILQISFSKVEIPLLTVGDSKGNISVWDLNEKERLSTFNTATSPIIFLQFLPSEQILVSATFNSIRQWKFSLSSPEKFIEIRNRTGLISPINQLQFYGEEGLHLIGSTKKDLRFISLLNDSMSRNFSYKNTEQGDILDFSFAENREKDWANVLTAHYEQALPCLFSTENVSIVKTKVQTKENSEIIKTFVSKCGNFGVLAFKNGIIIKINMQSGFLQRKFESEETKNKSVLGLFANQTWLVSLHEKGIIAKWDFYSGKLLEIKKIEKENLVPSGLYPGNRNLFGIVFGKISLEIWDIRPFSRARNFFCDSLLTDLCFSKEENFIFASFVNKRLKIYDLLSANSLLCDYALKYTINSISISTDSELLATVFQNSCEINLWHFQPLLASPVNGPIQIDFSTKIKGFPEIKKKVLIEKNNKKDLEIKIDKENKKLKKLTDLAWGKWQPLINLEEIKEKNKPIEPPKEIEIPFFLEFSKENKENDLKNQKKTRILKGENKEILEESLGNPVEIYLKDKNCEKLFENLKNQNASQIDFEFRKAVFENYLNIIEILKGFRKWFENNLDCDLKEVYLNCFLNCCYEQIVFSKESEENCKEILQGLIEIQKKNFGKINEEVTLIICLLEKFTNIK